jgi:hypothetical protein
MTMSFLNPGDRIAVGDAELVFGASGNQTPYPAYPVTPQPMPGYAPIWQAPPASPPIQAPRALLVDIAGMEICLQSGATLVGRESGLPICLTTDARVSRRHAEFTVDANRVVLRDLGSTNGTSVNGAKLVGPASLNDGDMLEFGSTRFTYRLR